MMIFLLVQVLVISSYGECHLVVLSHIMDFVKYFHVSPSSIVPSGNVLCSDRIILRMVWQSSTCHSCHTFYVAVGSFVCTYVRTKLSHPCTTVLLILSAEFSHPYRTVRLSSSRAFSIYIYGLDEFLYDDVVGDFLWSNPPCFDLLVSNK